MNTDEIASIQKEFTGILADFKSIGLKHMEEVHLMSRFDSKYIFPRSKLPYLLSRLKNEYQSLVIDHLPLFRYENLYFDTEDLKSYHDHHNGKAVRSKFRFRKYVDSEKCFFEVKVKTNKGLTEKSRLPTEQIADTLKKSHIDFLNGHINESSAPLVRQLINDFSRITLVNEKKRERLTFDLLVHFKNDTSDMWLNDLVVAELKQEQPTQYSSFKKLMQEERIFPSSFSKYCIGTLLTKPGIKYNRFKPKLIKLNKICNGID